MFTRIIFEIKLFCNLELPKGYCDWNNCVSLHFLLSGNWKLQFPGTEEIGDKYLFSYTDGKTYFYFEIYKDTFIQLTKLHTLIMCSFFFLVHQLHLKKAVNFKAEHN